MKLFGLDKWLSEWFGLPDYPLLPPPAKVLTIEGKPSVKDRAVKKPKEKTIS